MSALRLLRRAQRAASIGAAAYAAFVVETGLTGQIESCGHGRAMRAPINWAQAKAALLDHVRFTADALLPLGLSDIEKSLVIDTATTYALGRLDAFEAHYRAYCEDMLFAGGATKREDGRFDLSADCRSSFT